MFGTRATVRSKMLTSGRLTGADGTRRSPRSRPQPAYSLYSTDSENQVATLHKGLDRCAALLTDLLQCENQGGAPKQVRAVKDAVPKSRPHTPTGKKAIRRSLSKSGSNPLSAQVVRRKSSANPSTTTPQRSPAPPHSGIKLHPPVRKACLLKTPSKLSSPRPPRCPPLAPAQALAALDCVPERDQGPVDGAQGAEAEGKMRRVQGLLGELRTLMVGHGNSAQTYLHLLEQTALTALGSETSRSRAPSTSRSQGENTEVQLQRQVNVWNQRLQDQEATLQLLNSQVVSLKERLGVTEKELTNTRESLLETQSRLQSREEENMALKTELESTRGRLRGTLQDKFRLEGTVQQKEQEVEALRRIIVNLDSSALVPDTQPVCPPGPAKEHIAQYLLSLEPPGATQPPGARHKGPEHDVDSVISDWSVQSESSFNTRDEAAFRDGLAALDASIACLQKTLKLDRVKT
ncbi:uncharacterized protein [Eucyclogobius newberryi]|uniref:uncharacterized protein n=1 Tax=Eucyclogobius newberryi TaxID=166745 RepID=UPI003B58E29F